MYKKLGKPTRSSSTARQCSNKNRARLATITTAAKF